MTEENLKAKYDFKELELQALLEITQAINNNLSEEALYKIYNFTIRANLNINKLALYVLDDQWYCKTHFGTKMDFSHVLFDTKYLAHKKIHFITCTDEDPFCEFEAVIPVAHKERKLAYVFVGGNKEGDGQEGVNTNFVQAISNIIIVAIENKKLARRQLEQEMIRRELEIASNLQQYLFPKELPYNEKLKCAAFYQPHHSIGGDYYDFIEINEDTFLFCIADVSGKGIPAAMLMSNFQATLRTMIRQTTKLTEIINELNYQILRNAKGQHFITFFIGIYYRDTSRLKYVNAGHNPPILIDEEQRFSLLEKGSTILGAFDELPFLEVGILEDLKSFFFFSYTDGLIEITNEKNEEFGEERVKELIKKYHQHDLNELNQLIIGEMNSFKGSRPFKDDVTLFCTKVNNS